MLKPFKNIINSQSDWEQCLLDHGDLSGKIIQNVDLTSPGVGFESVELRNTIFLGCRLREEDLAVVIGKGAQVYPRFSELPYDPYRLSLYSWRELMNGYSEEEDESLDWKIYRHFLKYKYNPPIQEALAQRIHDFGIDESLRRLLNYDDQGMTEKKCVGIMGGHKAVRGSIYYVKVALTAKKLSEKGYYVTSGGGPGIMEAANLGAYFRDYSVQELLDAIDFLAQAPEPGSKGYHAHAEEILKRFPQGAESLALPTWFYGHEPSNLFAAHIAKYFSNSLREDMLLAINLYGVIYAPGSAGTTQEIFQDATQNHYNTFGYYSPMVFLGRARYVEETSIYSLLHQLALGQEYKKLLFLSDDPDEIVEFLLTHPPMKN